MSTDFITSMTRAGLKVKPTKIDISSLDAGWRQCWAVASCVSFELSRGLTKIEKYTFHWAVLIFKIYFPLDLQELVLLPLFVQKGLANVFPLGQRLCYKVSVALSGIE